MTIQKKKQSQKSKDASLRDRQIQTALWFAEMKTSSEVATLVREKYGITYERQTAHQFSKAAKWSKLILFLRKRFLKDLTKIPIANKAIRLRYLQNVYKEALTESLRSINQYGKVYELKLGAAITAIQAAREELEGKTSSIHVGEGGKIVFQDIKIEGRPVGELLRDINSRLSAQFGRK